MDARDEFVVQHDVAGRVSPDPGRLVQDNNPPDASALDDLKRQLAKATISAERAEALIDIQKKVAALLGTPLEDPPGRF